MDCNKNITGYTQFGCYLEPKNVLPTKFQLVPQWQPFTQWGSVPFENLETQYLPRFWAYAAGVNNLKLNIDQLKNLNKFLLRSRASLLLCPSTDSNNTSLCDGVYPQMFSEVRLFFQNNGMLNSTVLNNKEFQNAFIIWYRFKIGSQQANKLIDYWPNML